MENNNIAAQILYRIRTGSRKAFQLSKNGPTAELTFGLTTVPDVQFLIWLVGSQGALALSSRGPTEERFTFLFDGYGADPKRTHFALVKADRVVLDSDTPGVIGLFSIYTSAPHPMPLCILGLINHWGTEPSSIFLADRSEDLIQFTGDFARTIDALTEGFGDGE